MTNAINGAYSTTGVTGTNNLHDTMDVQLEFAKLQMELAKTNKESAMEKIKEIKGNQADAKRLVDLINKYRTAIGGEKDDKEVSVSISAEDKAFAERFGLTLKDKGTVAEFKTLVQQMQSVQETVNSDVQQQMVLIQDEMGKSSAYTQGSISAITKHTDTLTSVARG